jgi:hypothetical protein
MMGATAHIKNGRVVTIMHKDKDKKYHKDNLTAEERDIQLESLRNQLEKIKEQKSELDRKESTITKLIDKITQGE